MCWIPGPASTNPVIAPQARGLPGSPAPAGSSAQGQASVRTGSCHPQRLACDPGRSPSVQVHRCGVVLVTPCVCVVERSSSHECCLIPIGP
jgi:hypothetical protein